MIILCLLSLLFASSYRRFEADLSLWIYLDFGRMLGVKLCCYGCYHLIFSCESRLKTLDPFSLLLDLLLDFELI
jgi:hypothetical protein